MMIRWRWLLFARHVACLVVYSPWLVTIQFTWIFISFLTNEFLYSGKNASVGVQCAFRHSNEIIKAVIIHASATFGFIVWIHKALMELWNDIHWNHMFDDSNKLQQKQKNMFKVHGIKNVKHWKFCRKRLINILCTCVADMMMYISHAASTYVLAHLFGYPKKKQVVKLYGEPTQTKTWNED